MPKSENCTTHKLEFFGSSPASGEVGSEEGGEVGSEEGGEVGSGEGGEVGSGEGGVAGSDAGSDGPLDSVSVSYVVRVIILDMKLT